MALTSMLVLVRHTQSSCKPWLKKPAQLSVLLFDGDSDRLIAVDENGDIVDGDKVMYIIGKHLSQKGRVVLKILL